MKNRIVSQLQNKGHRITESRSAIINLLEHTDHPLTAKAIHKILDRVGTRVNITTVYREIEFLLDKKILVKVPLLDNELHYEINGPEHHHHAMCTVCGTIYQIKLESEQNLLEEAHHKIAFDIQRHSLAFFGICPSCK